MITAHRSRHLANVVGNMVMRAACDGSVVVAVSATFGGRSFTLASAFDFQHGFPVVFSATKALK